LIGAFVGPKWQASTDAPVFQRRSERWSIRVLFKATRRSIPLQIPFGYDYVSSRVVASGYENDWNCDRRSCGKADYRPASDTNVMLPPMPELILVSEKLGITRRTVGDVLPYLVGLQLSSGGNSAHHFIAGTAAAFRVRIVPEYGLLNRTTDLVKLLFRRFSH
jgi:hypothetical protein